MKRYDLRPLKDNFYERMIELMKDDIKDNEVAIFLFEVGDFTAITKAAELIYKEEYTLMNSIKFNEVDWTIVVKKCKPEAKITEEIQNKEESK